MRSTPRRALVPLLAVLLIAAAGRGIALVDAARTADHVTVRALLKQGANVNAAEADGTTALHWAAYRDD
ncbi:MAG: ankyrin repeat domain-containing protein, partial [Acidobacteriota bacterium]|nr:ankyrin repeat domain-containing protein [Acidobacteriota bacterium]